MADRLQRPTKLAPMPEEGTSRDCVFCHSPVTLSRTPQGEYYWTRAGEPPDGRRYCLGGVDPGNRYHTTPRTLHLPTRLPDGAQWAYWYTSDGEPRSA